MHEDQQDLIVRLMEENRILRQRVNALFFVVLILIVWMTGLSLGSDIVIAAKDRQQFPAQDWGYYYYFGTGHLPLEQQEKTAKVLMFVICSLNDVQVIEQQLPIRVAPTVWRMDTRQVGWEYALPKMLAKYYPYSRAPGALTLVIRADWFIQGAMDQEITGDSYYELIYGKVPKDLNEFLTLLGTTQNPLLEHGHIEARSGVAVQGTRLVRTLPTSGLESVWITQDTDEINRQTDPLENLQRNQKFQASEIIGSLQKSVATTGELGNLQVYALANDKGQLQTKAPANIVVDNTGTRGVEIRNPLSCISCHVEALRPLKDNALRQFIVSGAEAYTDYKTQQEIERFHLTKLDRLIERHNEDYAHILLFINGFTPAENAAAFQDVIRFYDRNLTLTDVAREYWCSPEELKHALAYYGVLPARFAQLAEGQPISRTSFEFDYRIGPAALEKWRKK